MKRVVFVCQVFYPDTSSTSQLFTELLTQLPQRGFSVEVICGYPGMADEGAELHSSLGAIKIHRCGLRKGYRDSLVSRGISYFAFLSQAALRLLRVHRDDIVLGVTNPAFTAQLLWLTSRIKRFRYQYMILDAFPEGFVALGDLRPGGVICTIWRFMNRLAYRAADRIVVLGRDMIPLFQTNYDLETNRFAYIPHWSVVDVQTPRPIEDSGMRKQLGLQDKFIVQYSGNMGLWHDMLTLVRAAQELQGEPGIHFLFIGRGRRRGEAEQLATDLQLDNMTWHDFVPLADLPESLSTCHCALISQNAGLEGVAVPCKVYGILASGRAIIAQVPSESEVAMTVAENDCGLVVRPGDVDGLVAAIRHLFTSPEYTAECGQRSFEAYRSKYQLSQAVDAFAKLWRNELA